MTGPAATRCSVIIVHRNGAETLLHALEAVAAAVDPARDAVFVVAFNLAPVFFHAPRWELF